jgi:hypothetical protein
MTNTRYNGALLPKIMAFISIKDNRNFRRIKRVKNFAALRLKGEPHRRYTYSRPTTPAEKTCREYRLSYEGTRRDGTASGPPAKGTALCVPLMKALTTACFFRDDSLDLECIHFMRLP